MSERQPIIRLDGEDVHRGSASLLVYRLNGRVEFVATERNGADAAVLLTRTQATELARALNAALAAKEGNG